MKRATTTHTSIILLQTLPAAHHFSLAQRLRISKLLATLPPKPKITSAA